MKRGVMAFNCVGVLSFTLPNKLTSASLQRAAASEMLVSCTSDVTTRASYFVNSNSVLSWRLWLLLIIGVISRDTLIGGLSSEFSVRNTIGVVVILRSISVNTTGTFMSFVSAILFEE